MKYIVQTIGGNYLRSDKKQGANQQVKRIGIFVGRCKIVEIYFLIDKIEKCYANK